MIASIKHYIYAAGAAFLAFLGIYLYREGREDERSKVERESLEAMQDAKEVRDEVEADPYFVDRARDKWVRSDDG